MNSATLDPVETAATIERDAMVPAPPRTAGRWTLLTVWVVIIGSAAVLGSQLVDRPSSLLAALQSLTPWAPPVLVGVAAIAWRTRNDQAGFTASGLALVAMAIATPVALPPSSPPAAPGATPIRVVSTNLLYSNDRLSDAADALIELDADVIGLIELTLDGADELAGHRLAERYPYRYERPAGAASGLAVWSRYPIVDARPLDRAERAIEATVVHPDGPMHVIVTHPTPPVVAPAAWADDMGRLPEIVPADGRPVIVLGDFNGSWFHPPFRNAVDDAQLTDALVVTGDGLDMTWPTDSLIPAFVALDHVLFGGPLTALDGRVVDVPGSDHRAVVADLAIIDR